MASRLVALWPVVALCAGWALLVGCRRSSPTEADGARLSSGIAARSTESHETAEAIYDGGLANGWQDWGWAPRELSDHGPAKI
ncbi:MAG: hypothetical protein ACREJ3_11740, partial [Polyangiaceae bacterium]